jgi:hypothetical protein
VKKKSSLNLTKGDIGCEISPGTRSTSQFNKEISKTLKSSKNKLFEQNENTENYIKKHDKR